MHRTGLGEDVIQLLCGKRVSKISFLGLPANGCCILCAAIELSSDRGILAARSRRNVLLTVRPTRRVSYHWKISYVQNTSDGRLWALLLCIVNNKWSNEAVNQMADLLTNQLIGNSVKSTQNCIIFYLSLKILCCFRQWIMIWHSFRCKPLDQHVYCVLNSYF